MSDQELKDKILQSAEKIPVPESLEPEKMEEKLSSVVQAKQKKSRFSRKLLSVAAALAVLVVSGAAVAKVFTEQQTYIETPEKLDSAQDAGKTDGSSQGQLASHGDEEYYGDIAELLNEYNDAYQGDVVGIKDSVAKYSDDVVEEAVPEQSANSATSSAGLSGAGGTGTDYSETDLQVKGVMEADIVKTDGTYIYAVNGGQKARVRIYRADGAKVEQVSQFAIRGSIFSGNEMYLAGDRLIILGNIIEENKKGSSASAEAEEDVAYSASAYGSVGMTTVIWIYDVSDVRHPKRLKTLKQSGTYMSSRVSGGYLYTFSNYQVYRNNCKDDEPEQFIPIANGECVRGNKILYDEDAKSNDYMVMTSLKVDGECEFQDSAAILGGAEVYYVSQDNIYAAGYGEHRWGPKAKSLIYKYGYRDGEFAYAGRTKAAGLIEDSYYMHEYNGKLAYVYTRNKKDGVDSTTTTNGLCVLDEKLEKLGEIAQLGNDERIYSSYYIDNMAYFVTYRETDPVFAVDISDPKNPALKSELKLPGFSEYLHSFGDDLLIGIGKGGKKGDSWEDSRVKVSVFGVGEDYELTEKETVLLEEDSESMAGYNHRCVFVDEERKLIGFEVEYWGVDEDEWGATNHVYYVVYGYQDGKLKKLMQCSTSPEDDYNALENVRGLRIGDYFYVINTGVSQKKGGIKVFDINTWDKARS